MKHFSIFKRIVSVLQCALIIFKNTVHLLKNIHSNHNVCNKLVSEAEEPDTSDNFEELLETKTELKYM